MKRLKVLWIVIPLLLFAVVWRVQRQRLTSTEYILSRYPEVRGNMGGVRDGLVKVLDNGTTIHTLLGFCWYPDRNLPVYNTFILYEDGNAVATEDPVGNKTSGYVSEVREWRFTATELQTAKSTLPNMSPISEAPAFEDFLFVGFLDGNRWTTRVYNRRNLPAPVRTLIRLAKIKQNQI